MLMYNGNQYILLGCLYLVGVEAFGLDFDFWHKDEAHHTPSYTTLYEPSYATVEPEFYPPQNAFYPEIQEAPVYQEPSPVFVEPVTPVRIETVHVMDKVEQFVHVPHVAPLELRKIKFMSTTETVTITARSLYRSTVVITPTVSQTATKVVQTSTVMNRNVIHETETTVTETILDVHTITKPQLIHKTVSSPIVMYLTVEAETTETVWQPYTLTTTSRQLITIWTTRTVELASENSVLIPVVEVETVTTTVPYHVTSTDWITRTDTTTVCKEW